MDIITFNQNLLHLNKIHPISANGVDVVVQDIDVLRFKNHEPVAPGRNLVVLKRNTGGAYDQKRTSRPVTVAYCIHT